MTMGGGVGSRAIKDGGGEKLVQITLHPYVSKKIKNNYSSPSKYVCEPTNDLHVRWGGHPHPGAWGCHWEGKMHEGGAAEVAGGRSPKGGRGWEGLERGWGRKGPERDRGWRGPEDSWGGGGLKKDWGGRKSLEGGRESSSRGWVKKEGGGVGHMVKIAQEEEAWRALEASGRALGSGISGYRKGKAPKKRVCMNCLRKGIECEWDEGSQGKPEIYIYIYWLVLITVIGTSCTQCQNSKIQCIIGGSGLPMLKRPHMEEL